MKEFYKGKYIHHIHFFFIIIISTYFFFRSFIIFENHSIFLKNNNENFYTRKNRPVKIQKIPSKLLVYKIMGYKGKKTE